MWGVESWFVQVTLVPALTVSVCGAKVKFWMATVWLLAGAAAADDEAAGMAAAPVDAGIGVDFGALP